MTKKIKRVPLDFDWKLNIEWWGYINPLLAYRVDCPDCTNGWSNHMQNYLDTFYADYSENAGWRNKITQTDLDVLTKKDRLHRFTHETGLELTVENVNLVNSHDYRGKGVMIGHDAMNRIYMAEARTIKDGHIPECDTCKGNNYIFGNQELQLKYDTWEDEKTPMIEPPTGEGYQYWNWNKPQSPVFTTERELQEWMENNERNR